ncbi:hypothetical protein [Paraburkholderia sp. RL17-373-BIF-A]|uniref:hypothetical protein n=1 Tax=Paraburkholderia sp. RL17-373-BIF-A TaxID=3031629 RepID=UPI0038B852FB
MPHSTEVATRSARMMMHDAFESVSKAHTGLTKHYLSNQARTFVATWQTESQVSLGVGVAITVGVAIAGIATGGIAIPVLIGIAAGSYAIKNAIESIGANERRVNRNWLQRYPAATAAAGKDLGAFLTVEASDSLRRAVDHFTMMRTIVKEVETAAVPEFISCEEAINYVKALSRFIHHSDKVRNYTLPVLDLLIFYLGEYKKLTEQWGTAEAKISAALQSWFEKHGEHSCCPGGGRNDVCYAPFSGLTVRRGAAAMPAKRHAEASSTMPAAFAAVAPAPGSPGAVQISTLLEGMIAARDKIVAGMHASSGATWNYSAERPVTTRARSGGVSVVDNMHRRRLDALLDTVWRQVDRPGYFSRATRRAGHWYTRNTGSEKAGALLSEMLSVGSIFMPFIGDASALTKIGASAVSGSVSTAVLAGDKIGLNLLKGADGIPIRSSLLDHSLVDAHATNEIREAGAGIEKLLPKLMLHFKKAAEALKALDESPQEIKSCNDAMAFTTKTAEIIAQMEKVSRYAGPCVGIVDVLCKQCYDWSEKEHDLWQKMEQSVSEWLREDDGHQNCRHAGTKCYGAKHHRVGPNIFGQGGTWTHLTNDPHNPLT